MAHWLVKSEPGVYSIDDLAREGQTPWDGIRNAQARNFVRRMADGDLAVVYHSGKEKAAVGIGRVVGSPRPDPLQFDSDSDKHDATSDPGDPRWWLVDLAFAGRFVRPVPLAAMKQEDRLAGMLLWRQGRLSVTPLTDEEFRVICALGAVD